MVSLLLKQGHAFDLFHACPLKTVKIHSRRNRQSIFVFTVPHNFVCTSRDQFVIDQCIYQLTINIVYLYRYFTIDWYCVLYRRIWVKWIRIVLLKTIFFWSNKRNWSSAANCSEPFSIRTKLHAFHFPLLLK